LQHKLEGWGFSFINILALYDQTLIEFLATSRQVLLLVMLTFLCHPHALPSSTYRFIHFYHRPFFALRSEHAEMVKTTLVL